MSFPTDLEIADSANIQHIKIIADKVGIDDDDLAVRPEVEQARTHFEKPRWIELADLAAGLDQWSPESGFAVL